MLRPTANTTRARSALGQGRGREGTAALAHPGWAQRRGRASRSLEHPQPWLCCRWIFPKPQTRSLSLEDQQDQVGKTPRQHQLNPPGLWHGNSTGPELEPGRTIQDNLTPLQGSGWGAEQRAPHLVTPERPQEQPQGKRSQDLVGGKGCAVGGRMGTAVLTGAALMLHPNTSNLALLQSPGMG